MARKKRPGSRPGSKNKLKFTGAPAQMDIAQLSRYIFSLRNTLGSKIERQREYFERQLAVLGSYGNGRRGSGSGRARTDTRRKPEPKYCSKKNPSLKWTGRGVLPVWMREEIKGTKLRKDDFLIK
jgi:DNA-binding protein H-NS